jgi:hypothetical protein
MLPALLAIAAIIAVVAIGSIALVEALTSARDAADANFSSAPVGSTTKNCPYAKQLKGKVKQVTWGGGIKVSSKSGLTRVTVPTPHWQEGTTINDGGGSLRPGVLLIGGIKGTGDTTLQVEITENVNVRGDGIVRGTLGSLEFEGRCPTAVGVHQVQAVFKTDPDSIGHLQGDVTWGIEVADLGGSVALANATRLEAFVVLDTPATFYGAPGVWVEALRFMCDRVGVTGLKTPADVAARTATYCHSSHGLIYDTYGGAPAYGGSGSGGTFKLEAYMAAALTVVNCYDQAGAVQSLCGATGTILTWYYLDPFGFINTTQLIGVGACNSPFYSSNGTPPMMPVNDPLRSAFGNHAFVGLGGKIVDACAGPHIGTETQAQYCSASIDSATTLYSLYVNFLPGTAAGMATPAGVTQVV